MTVAVLVAALGLELDDPQLRPALMGDDLRLHDGGGERLAVGERIAVDEQQRLQIHGCALVGRESLDEQGLTLLDAILLAARLDDCVVHACHSPPAAEPARALERRRPPLRPRRRADDSSSSASSSGSSPPTAPLRDAAGPASTSVAVASVRPTCSIRTRCFSPTCRVASAIEMMYPSILATPAPGVYMCGSTIST